jgi:CheY-like chemotaxis protein
VEALAAQVNVVNLLKQTLTAKVGAMTDVSLDELMTIRGKTFLIVDDSPEMRIFLSRSLVMFGCKVSYANNGAEAVEKVSDKNFDVILMDLCMPVLDGQSATQMIRATGYDGLILGITAKPELLQEKDPVDIGFNECFIKPINRIHLVSRISSLALKRAT